MSNLIDKHKSGFGRATRRRHEILWVSDSGAVHDVIDSSTRRRRAQRHVARLRGTRQDEDLEPILKQRTK